MATMYCATLLEYYLIFQNQKQAPPRRYERGYGWMFGQHILQAHEGCDFDFLETSFGAPVAEPSIF